MSSWQALRLVACGLVATQALAGCKMFEPLAIAFGEIGASMKPSPTPTPIVEEAKGPPKASFVGFGNQMGSASLNRNDFVDLSVGENGLIAVCDDKRLFLSSDQGQNWTVGPDQDTGTETAMRALAVRPDGSQVFVGSVAGKYRLYDGRSGKPITTDWTTQSVSPHSFRQAQFLPGQEKPVLWATLANDLTSEGALVQGVIQREGQNLTSWEDLGPLRRRSDPQATPKCSFWGLGITKSRGTEQTAFVGGRRNVGVNAYQDVFRVKLTLGNYYEDWVDQHRPVNYGQALAISCVGRYGEPTAITYSENRLYMGGFADTLQPLETTGLEGLKVLALKFAPDRHLLALTTRQLLRSTEAF